jgi:hypothetical protein
LYSRTGLGGGKEGGGSASPSLAARGPDGAVALGPTLFLATYVLVVNWTLLPVSMAVLVDSFVVVSAGAAREPAARAPSASSYWPACESRRHGAARAPSALSLAASPLHAPQRVLTEFQRKQRASDAAVACAAKTPSVFVAPRRQLCTAARAVWFGA